MDAAHFVFAPFLGYGYPLKAGQLEYDRRYSKMHGLSVTGRPWL